jgi:hypothetical protein
LEGEVYIKHKQAYDDMVQKRTVANVETSDESSSDAPSDSESSSAYHEQSDYTSDQSDGACAIIPFLSDSDNSDDTDLRHSCSAITWQLQLQQEVISMMPPTRSVYTPILLPPSQVLSDGSATPDDERNSEASTYGKQLCWGCDDPTCP